MFTVGFFMLDSSFLGGGRDLRIELNRLYVCIFACLCLSIDVLLELDNTIRFWMLRGFPIINKEWKVICSNSEIAAGLVWARGILNGELTETWIVCYWERKPPSSDGHVDRCLGAWPWSPGRSAACSCQGATKPLNSSITLLEEWCLQLFHPVTFVSSYRVVLFLLPRGNFLTPHCTIHVSPYGNIDGKSNELRQLVEPSWLPWISILCQDTKVWGKTAPRIPY